MGKIQFLFILIICSTLSEVRCLECYVCDNCSKVKLSEIQTCATSTIPGSSTTTTTTTKFTNSTTITTEPATTVTIATASTTTSKLPTISTSTTTNSTPISITAAAEPITNFMPTTTEFVAPATTSVTKYPKSSTEPALISITNATTRITPLGTTATKPSVLLTTESNIFATDLTAMSTTEYLNTTTEPNISYATESIKSSTSTFEPVTDLTTYTKEPEVNSTPSESIKKFTTDTNTLITTEPITIATTDPSSTYPIESTVTSTKNSTESSSTIISSTFIGTQPVTTEPMTTTNYMTEEPIKGSSKSTDPAILNIEPNRDKNASNYSLARILRSVPKGCACNNVDKCDCSIIYRSKRYALRGLATNQNLKYTCVVDKYEVNGAEIIRRGCAILEEDEKNSCEKSGFGPKCRTCDTDLCNGASMTHCSALLLVILYFIRYF